MHGHLIHLHLTLASATKRRARFRRSSEPVPFRITDGDTLILRRLARYRFLPSTHVAALIGRSLDRANDRLRRLYHAGYVGRGRSSTTTPHPVMLLPGWVKVRTKPDSRGFVAGAMTIGIVDVDFWAAAMAGVAFATITSGFSATILC